MSDESALPAPMAGAAAAPVGFRAAERVGSVDWRWVLAALLFAHVLVWTWAGTAGRSNLDHAGDMVEAYVWGQSFEWGYLKHPPLSAWIAGAWFRWVPEGHAGYALLSALNAAFGLAGVAALARRFLPARWALLAMAATALTPGFTTLAMRFNPNAVLLSTWPWATFFFVRLMQGGRRVDGVLCGLACALAMLGKYYSGVLLLTLLSAALANPAWRRRFAGGAFWLAVATLLLALAPHANWLLQRASGPLQYAQAAAAGDPAGATERALRFGIVQLLYPTLALVLLALTLEPGRRRQALRAALAACLRPRLAPLWLLAAGPVVVTMLATAATGARTATVWGMPIAGGVCLLLVAHSRQAGGRLALRRGLTALAMAWAVVLVAAPLRWEWLARRGADAAAEPRAELAAALAQRWRDEFLGPLPWVSGTRALAMSASFYSSDHPHYWSLWNAALETPWVDREQVFGKGGIVVCQETDLECQDIAGQWSQWREWVAVAKHERGHAFEPRRYVLYLLPPRSGGD